MSFPNTTPPWSPANPTGALRVTSRFHTTLPGVAHKVSGDIDMTLHPDGASESELRVEGLVVTVRGDATESFSSVMRRIAEALMHTTYPIDDMSTAPDALPTQE